MSVTRRTMMVLLFLLIISPFFGVIGANLVGYREPLELALEQLGIEESEPIWAGFFPDYTVPGLNDVVGYIISGVIGLGIFLLPAYFMIRAKRK